MRSKAPLALIEQAIMLLVFALAAVLCLRAFVWADRQSDVNASRDRAMLQAQTAAETLKYCRGDYSEAAKMAGGEWDGKSWSIGYDETWNVTDEDELYLLQVVPNEGKLEYLGQAEVEVRMNGEELVRLPVSWQEVSSGE